MTSLITPDVSLAQHTTLGVGGVAQYYGEARNLAELRELYAYARAHALPVTIFGGGSNVLVRDNGIKGLVIRPLFEGVSYREEGDRVCATVGAGVVLDTFIDDVVSRELWGIENLSGIPGTVGGVPIQNVGAYGVEASDVVASVSVYDPGTDTASDFDTQACMFAYRDSVFKHAGKTLVVTAVTFHLSHTPEPKLGYKDLAQVFGTEGRPSLREIREAVLRIRGRKFPDWHVVGTAGSFFKNPIVDRAVYERIQSEYPEIVAYPVDDARIKLSLGWILDRVCGLRGYTDNHVGLYKEQALVLVCDREASAEDILKFSDQIIARVYEALRIHVEREVTIIGE
jgi:UDP-N-acetylmuramate dehydrogenase